MTLRTLLLPLAAAAALAAPAAANAGVLVASADSCPADVLERPFAPWLDPAQYVQAGDAGFESGAAGWTLTGRAHTRAGNEPWYVRSDGDRNHLVLPSRASATSPVQCVGVEHPTIRFFVKRLAGTALSTLHSTVLVDDAFGVTHELALLPVTAGPSWSVGPVIPIVANLLTVVPGERTAVRFRFHGSDGSAWAIDDLYVDPWGRN